MLNVLLGSRYVLNSAFNYDSLFLRPIYLVVYSAINPVNPPCAWLGLYRLHIHTHTHIATDFLDKSIFKKPGVRRHLSSLNCRVMLNCMLQSNIFSFVV